MQRFVFPLGDFPCTVWIPRSNIGFLATTGTCTPPGSLNSKDSCRYNNTGKIFIQNWVAPLEHPRGPARGGGHAGLSYFVVHSVSQPSLLNSSQPTVRFVSYKARHIIHTFRRAFAFEITKALKTHSQTKITMPLTPTFTWAERTDK
eukprot:4505052-Pyramimonas_sp.AAC.1